MYCSQQHQQHEVGTELAGIPMSTIQATGRLPYLISHRTVLLLTGRVKNIENTCFVVDRDLLSITILCAVKPGNPESSPTRFAK
jgi:hypothetical protein